MVQFDEIGSVVRSSPFKVLVMVLDLVLMVNDFEMPALPPWLAFWTTPPEPPPWAESVWRPGAGELVNASECFEPFARCQAVGRPVALDGDGGASGACNASYAWFPEHPRGAWEHPTRRSFPTTRRAAPAPTTASSDSTTASPLP